VTPDEIRARARRILQRAKAELTKTATVQPAVYFLPVNGEEEVLIELPGEIMNVPEAKAVLFGFITDLARSRQAELAAVLTLTDIWTLRFTEEQQARLADPIARAEYDELSRDFNGGLQACAAAGYGELMEGLILGIQTPLFNGLFTQIYRRAGAEKRHIIFEEYSEQDDTGGGALQGRLFKIWPTAQGAAQ